MTQRLHRQVFTSKKGKCPHNNFDYIQMFLTLLPVIDPNWKQRKRPSISERINKLWLEYYTAIKQHPSDTWMNLRIIMLSERSHTKKEGTWYMFYVQKLYVQFIICQVYVSKAVKGEEKAQGN